MFLQTILKSQIYYIMLPLSIFMLVTNYVILIGVTLILNATKNKGEKGVRVLGKGHLAWSDRLSYHFLAKYTPTPSTTRRIPTPITGGYTTAPMAIVNIPPVTSDFSNPPDSDIDMPFSPMVSFDIFSSKCFYLSTFYIYSVSKYPIQPIPTKNVTLLRQNPSWSLWNKSVDISSEYGENGMLSTSEGMLCHSLRSNSYIILISFFTGGLSSALLPPIQYLRYWNLNNDKELHSWLYTSLFISVSPPLADFIIHHYISRIFGRACCCLSRPPIFIAIIT